ncbi:hypothetical protein [Staphylococcus pseudintermedius]|uniref:hypothetical protein n=2 Tax=Staphylococcus pseudintermedius TaxID=283734 RepID=UPI001F5BFDB1|nr:hypothetical protein [Staphylococcus pseudintermedius]MDK4128232.1 hypothetical protein [Staphylococcus pseudintermedius]
MLAHEEKLYVYRENNIFKKLSKDKASKIQGLLGKDRDIRISNVREAKYSIQENIDMYEKYINKIILKYNYYSCL